MRVSIFVVAWALCLSGCSLAIKRAGEAVDTAAGKQAFAAVGEKMPELASELAEEAKARREREESFPWIRTILAHWLEILMVLVVPGGVLALRQWRQKKKLQAIATVFGAVVDEVKEHFPSILEVIRREAAAKGLGTSVREAMRRSGVDVP